MQEQTINAITPSDALVLLRRHPLDKVVKIDVVQGNPTGQGPVTVNFYLKLSKSSSEEYSQVLKVENIFHCGDRKYATWRLNDAIRACGVTIKDATEIFWTTKPGVYTFVPANAK